MKSTTATTPILLVSIIIQAFLLVNGSELFGSLWGSYQDALVMYVLLDSLFLSLSFTKLIPFIQIGFWDAVTVFVPVFIIGGFLFQSLFKLSPIAISVNNFYIDMIFQIFVVAFTEEMLFRGILLQYIGAIPQGIIFGLFHYTAYYTITGLNIVALLIAMAMGILFGYIVKYFTMIKLPGVGLTITWALHSAWNIAITTTIFVIAI